MTTHTPAEQPQHAAAPRRVRVHHLREAKSTGRQLTMLTAYDGATARIFDAAGVDMLLVGDSIGDNMLGHETTIPVTVDEMVVATRSVARATARAMGVADLPFGSYEASPAQAHATAVRMLKEAGAHAVKFEGGRRVAAQVELLSGAGIPVVGHVGFTPQSEHALGGYRVQGRGEGGEVLMRDAKAMEAAGAFAIVLEVVPSDLADRVTRSLSIPTIGIGAGAGTDAQVLVWQDMAGYTSGKTARFVKRFGDVGGELRRAATQYASEVASGTFPAEAHCF